MHAKSRRRIGDFACGTIGGAAVGALFVGAIVAVLTGRSLAWVPTPAWFFATGPVLSRVLYAAYYDGVGCAAFLLFRFAQELLRGHRWREALAEARRMPSVW